MDSNLFLNNIGFSGFWGGLFFVAIIWSLIWKGLALWKAAKKENKVWFIVLLVLNTFGILEILYLYVFSEAKSLKNDNNQPIDNK
ncbi:MAG: DUF5652 family protein [bacterium]|nr:DUF5652 family protein [Patescibacteria group bacterium]MDW8280023.1 DUF5652 family protein [bacterium]